MSAIGEEDGGSGCVGVGGAARGALIVVSGGRRGGGGDGGKSFGPGSDGFGVSAFDFCRLGVCWRDRGWVRGKGGEGLAMGSAA